MHSDGSFGWVRLRVFNRLECGGCRLTLAHQAGRVISNVAFQLQKFNPLFTLVFTQITAMKFTVFGNVLSNITKVESHWKNFVLKVLQCDSTVTENIPEYCKFHSSDLGKNQCKQGIKFLKLKCHSGIALAYLKRRSIVDSPQLPPTGALKSLEGPYRAESWSVNRRF